MKADEVIVPMMLTQFRRAATVYHWGREQEDADMESVGIKSAQEAAEALEACKDGRLTLVPFLDDTDPSVRVFAAGFLVKVLPERALAVLNEMDERCPTDAHMTAFWFLQRNRFGQDL